MPVENQDYSSLENAWHQADTFTMTFSYIWTRELRAIYDKSVDLYARGNRDLESYFSLEETSFLASIGLRRRIQ